MRRDQCTEKAMFPVDIVVFIRRTKNNLLKVIFRLTAENFQPSWTGPCDPHGARGSERGIEKSEVVFPGGNQGSSSPRWSAAYGQSPSTARSLPAAALPGSTIKVTLNRVLGSLL